MNTSKDNEFKVTGNEHQEAERSLGKYTQKETGAYKELDENRLALTSSTEMNMHNFRWEPAWNNYILAKETVTW